MVAIGKPKESYGQSRRLAADREVCKMKTKTCPDCNGDCVVDKDTDDERQCPTCGGLGFVRDDDRDEEVIKTSRGEQEVSYAKLPIPMSDYSQLNPSGGLDGGSS